MPDWSYHTLFQHGLLKMPGHIGREFIHKSMAAISALPGGRQLIRFLGHVETNPHIQVKTSDILFSTPIGLSGKIDPNLTATNAFANLGFGFIEIGPVTLDPFNPKEKPYYDKHNKVVFPHERESIGLAKTIKRLKQYDKLPVHKMIRMKGTIMELIELAKALNQYAEIFVLEYSSKMSVEEIRAIMEKLDGKRIFLSITTEQFTKSVTSSVKFIDECNFDGIVLDSDRETNPLSSLLPLLKRLKLEIGDSKPIITSGGIEEPKDAITLLKEGASLLLLSAGYVTSGPGLPKRINELIYHTKNDTQVTISTGWIWYWLFGLCIVLSGMIALIFSMTRVILPYDESFLGIARNELLMFNEKVLFFMAHDRMTLSGTMISSGIIYMQLAKHGVKYGVHWCRKAVNIAGVIGFLGILLFIGYGYFDWLHGLLWLILLPFFILGYVKTKDAIQTPKSSHDSNHLAWKSSLYGQLAFIILGFSLIIGGISISYIGATFVFVQTDIGYLCMPPEMIQQFNEKLISVIAHDRAGFGSALLSTGLLVLMVSLWGYREGEKWVWRSLFIGGLPAFLAGIITHFVIGYTTFIHLLPAYLAFGLYICGLLLSYPFLMRKYK